MPGSATKVHAAQTATRYASELPTQKYNKEPTATCIAHSGDREVKVSTQAMEGYEVSTQAMEGYEVSTQGIERHRMSTHQQQRHH